jgi:outer membrane protein OmpA-like peptidoglycan-associated protein
MKVAVPLDDKINTAGDELFPTMHGDTLYFSSDGWAGLGGLDIYKTIPDGDTWKTPVNLGYPINSSFDDFGIIFANGTTKGHFSSNRLGSDDIFAFDDGGFNVMQLNGTVLDKSNMRRLESTKVMIREVINEKITRDSLLTNFTGNFRFPLKTNHNYYLCFTKDGYTEDSVAINKSAIAKDIELKPILLAPIPKPVPPPVQTVVIKDSDGDGVEDSKDKCPDKKGTKENFGCPDIQARLNELAKMVFFKTASAELSPAALKPLNEAVEILNEYPNTTLAIEGHTDNRAGAAYNKDLSQRRANSVKAFFVGKGLKESRFTSVVGYGLERPIATNDTEEGRALNRRVSIKATFVY